MTRRVESHAPGEGETRPQPSEVIITHAGADFDGLASMFCARLLYPGAMPLLIGPPDLSVRAFLDAYGTSFPIQQAHDVASLPLTRVVLVDVQVPARLGPFREIVSDARVEVHVYDHHPPTAESIQGDVHCVERVGATITLLVNRLMARLGGPPTLSPIEATLFAIGIYEETGGLTFPETTPADARAVAWLLEQGANLSCVTDFTQPPLREEQHTLLRAFLERSQMRDIRGMRVLVCRAESERYVGETAVVAHRIMDLERPDALLCVTRMGDRAYIVARSRESGPDVSGITAHFGGGGHPRAASAAMAARPLDAIVEEIWRVVEREARPGLCARDVMSAPLQHIDLVDDPTPTVEDVRDRFLRHGHTVLPVLSTGSVHGCISRRDIDKAMQHGLGATSVLPYISPSFPTVPLDLSARDLLRRLSGAQTRAIVVDERGQAAGIVTRADVLEALRRQSQPVTTEVGRLERLPLPLRRLLRRCGEVGDALEMNVYVVGGFVRDVLLERETLDVDVVVEGDGIRYAAALAQALGARVSAHHKFGTAVVTRMPREGAQTGDDTSPAALPTKIDVASTRLEFYTRPAALPEVTGSTLKADLHRRDFSINAMAIQLNGASFGHLVDFFGARRDLEEGVVRVLHSLSFVDDPTRIFRAIKFEQRYHFRMDAHTEALLRHAARSGWLEALSPARVRDEFEQILSEARPVPAIVRMAQLRVLHLIHPGLSLGGRVRALLDEITGVLLRYAALVEREHVRRWLVYFRGLASGLSEAALHAVADRYAIGQASRSRLFLERDHVRLLLRRLYGPAVPPSEVYRLLSPLSLEMVLYLLARSNARSVKERIMLFLDRLRLVTPLVTGDHLKRWGIPPGPQMGRTLTALLEAQIDGCFRDVDGGRAWLAEKDIPASWT